MRKSLSGNFGSVESSPQLTKGMKEEMMGAQLQTAEKKKLGKAHG